MKFREIEETPVKNHEPSRRLSLAPPTEKSLIQYFQNGRRQSLIDPKMLANLAASLEESNIKWVYEEEQDTTFAQTNFDKPG